MKRAQNQRSGKSTGLQLRTRGKSLQPNSTCMCADPQHEAGNCAMTCDVSGPEQMLVRVCWERQIAVAATVTSYAKRQPRKSSDSPKDEPRIKKISVQNTIRQVQNLVREEQCFVVIEAPLPREMNWEEALKFRNGYGRRVRDRLDGREAEVPTFISIVTTRYEQPHGLLIYCPDDMNPNFEVFKECTHHVSPLEKYIDFEEVASHVFDLHNDLWHVPKGNHRYFASRGHRLHIDEFLVSSIEEGRALLEEKSGPDFRVTVAYAQPHGARRRAEYQILPAGTGPAYPGGLVKE